MKIGYAVLFLGVIIASIWYAAAVASGRTLFPKWMALANPVVTTIAWLVLRRILPRKIADYAEGAGFNIAYMIFFTLTTATLS